MYLTRTIAVATLMLSCVPANALVLSLREAGTGESLLQATPGSRFSIDVIVDTEGVSIVSAEGFLQSSVLSVLSLMASPASTYGPAWDPNTTTAAFPIVAGGLDPLSPKFGSLPLAGMLTGSTTLATLQIQVNPSAPAGDYLLTPFNFTIGDATFNDIGPVARLQGITVHIPEPATGALLALGVLPWLSRRKRSSGQSSPLR